MYKWFNVSKTEKKVTYFPSSLLLLKSPRTCKTSLILCCIIARSGDWADTQWSRNKTFNY